MCFDENEQNILQKVYKRVRERRDSLKPLENRQEHIGFEGWLKVEAIASLEVLEVRNHGPDLLVSEGGSSIEVELKTGTWFELSNDWLEDATRNATCLFLVRRPQNNEAERIKAYQENFQIVYRDIDDYWMIGLAKRKTG